MSEIHNGCRQSDEYEGRRLDFGVTQGRHVFIKKEFDLVD